MKTIRTIQDKRVLIVGGAGFIGSHLADQLLQSPGIQVAVIDNLFLGKIENLKSAILKGLRFYELDAEDASAIDRILKEFKPEVIINCATKALNHSFIDPMDAFATNTQVILNLLETLRLKRYETLCHLSSSEVYGSAVYEPMDEKHPIHPTTTYAAGKAAADLALESYVRMFGVDAFILRPFNNFGPRQNSRPPLAGIIPLTIGKLLQGQAPELHGDGKQTRDFTYVVDTARIIMELYARLPRGESVHIASTQVLTMQNVLTQICNQMGVPPSKIVRKDARPSDVKAHAACTQKMKSYTSAPFTSFEDGLKKTIAWFKSEEFTK